MLPPEMVVSVARIAASVVEPAYERVVTSPHRMMCAGCKQDHERQPGNASATMASS
jgi:hypothetical protein